MATRLFNRAYRIVIDTLEITDLRCVFQVDKDLTGKPNKASAAVYNLNPDHTKAVSQMGAVPVQIEAGYVEGTSVLFLGVLRTSGTKREGQDLITVVESGDGEAKLQRARINKSLPAGVTTDEVLRQVATSLGVNQGNLPQALRTIKTKFSGVGNVFSAGVVLSGSAVREMNSLCRSLDLEWSVQNGALQILERGKGLAKEAILLNAATGLIGAPEIDGKGVLTCRSLMIPDAIPGRIALLYSEFVKGQFRIESTSHQGDTHGDNWGVEIKGKRY